MKIFGGRLIHWLTQRILCLAARYFAGALRFATFPGPLNRIHLIVSQWSWRAMAL